MAATVHADAQRLREVFEDEADVMARLASHPSIVTIHQASISLDGSPYIAMEYCPASMGALTKGKPAPLADVLDAGVRIAGALETAHRAGVLHRDIKPSNVLLTTLGKPVLADFGIAYVTQRGQAEEAEVAMSIPWSSPEVLQLKVSGSVSSEVWSLGATLYSFAAGRSPFELPDRSQNSRSKLSDRIMKAIYPSIPGAQGYEPFDEVLSRALRRDPADRFSSMAELGEALQGLQRGYGFDVTPLEVVAEAWLPRTEAIAAGTRGPVVSSVGRVSRADARAEQLAQLRGTDKDGLVLDQAGWVTAARGPHRGGDRGRRDRGRRRSDLGGCRGCRVSAPSPEQGRQPKRPGRPSPKKETPAAGQPRPAGRNGQTAIGAGCPVPADGSRAALSPP